MSASEEPAKHAQIRSSVARSTVSNYLGTGLLLGVWFFLTPFMVSRLGKTDYGLWVLITPLAAYGAVLSSGIGSAVTKYVAEYRAQDDSEGASAVIATSLWIYCAFGVLVIVLGVLFAPLAPHVIRVPARQDHVTSTVVILAAITVAVELPATTAIAALRSMHRFDLINVIQGDAKLPQALIRDKRIEGLSLLPASQTRDKDALSAEGVARVIAELREKFDWVICDSPAGIEKGATLAMHHADAAVVVTNPEVSSVRDSDRIIGMLDSKTAKAARGERIEKHLLLTRYDPMRAQRGEMLKVEDVLEILSIPLLGIIPESEEVLRASNLGSPVTLNAPQSGPGRAYFDAARRLMGETVPQIMPGEKRGLISKLFGRRVA